MMTFGRWAVWSAMFTGAVMSFTGCTGENKRDQVIRTNDARVRNIHIADGAAVYKACYRPGGKKDDGQNYGHDASFGGCYDPNTLEIWINDACDLLAALRHELCHAFGEVSDKECDRRHPVKDICPPAYHYGTRYVPGERK